MGSNAFGTLFRITTWGESHGPAIGVVIDGCPAGLPLNTQEIQEALLERSPGYREHTSAREERDQLEVLSGVFKGKTTGTPLSLLIRNTDARSEHYAALEHLLRPGHANYTYLQKYGLFDHRGGGRASARETACRVAAGAVARQCLAHFEIEVLATLQQVGTVVAPHTPFTRQAVRESPLFCHDAHTSSCMSALLEEVAAAGDSIGGVVAFTALNVPVGLGDPLYSKLEAQLAHAMMSLPASKGFEMGLGFQAALLRGSVHNDLFAYEEGRVVTRTEHAGGTLGGISTGMPLTGRVIFKPTSSIQIAQPTLTLADEPTTLTLPEGSRHDPCVAIRAVPVVEAMLALVLIDALLLNRCARL